MERSDIDSSAALSPKGAGGGQNQISRIYTDNQWVTLTRRLTVWVIGMTFISASISVLSVSFEEGLISESSSMSASLPLWFSSLNLGLLVFIRGF
jgi:hypothetical protein